MQDVQETLSGKRATCIPEGEIGWWGGPARRVRCRMHGKVVLSEEKAERCAFKVREKGDVGMAAYQGECSWWHVGHQGRRRRRAY